MTYGELEIKLKVKWLDENETDNEERKEMIAEKLRKLITHEFAKMAKERHGVFIDIYG